MRTFILLVSACLGSAALAQDHRLTSARLDGDVLRLHVIGHLEEVRHFALPSPPRVVLDLFGIGRSTAEMPAPAARSPALEVRTGQHARFLRLVVDLHEDLETYDVRRSAGTIEVGLGPARLPPSRTAVVIGISPIPADPSQPPAKLAPVVAIGVEAAPPDAAAVSRASTPIRGARPSAAVARRANDMGASSKRAARTRGSSLQNLDDLTTDELLALIDEELDELEAAGLGQEQSAEELIEQVEAALDANELERPAIRTPRLRDALPTEERRLWRQRRNPLPRPREGEERLPFRFVDEGTARESPAEKPPAEEDGPDGS